MGSGHAEMVNWLLCRKADANTRVLPSGLCPGTVPLHFAAQEGHEACCHLLLQHRADVDACNEDGFTPIHGAVMNPVLCIGSHQPEARHRVLRLLLAARADPQANQKLGSSSLDDLARYSLPVAAEEIAIGSAQRCTQLSRVCRRCF